MFKKTLSFVLASLMLLSASIYAWADSGIQKPAMPECDEYGFAEVNGIRLEYGIYGSQNEKTMLLFSSNGGQMHSFDNDILPWFARDYRVIAMSMRGQGNSDRGTGKLTFDVMADDVNAFMELKGINSAYIFGFSDGGNLGLVFTLKYPEKVDKLAIMGSNINMWGTKPSSEIGIVISYFYLCLKAFITKDPADELERDTEGMMVGQPKLTFDDLHQIKIPVYNIYGQHDMILRSHSRKITKSIPDCRELMVMGGAHSSCFDYTDTLLAPTLLEFFADTASE